MKASPALAGLATTLLMGCASPPVYTNLLHPEYGQVHFDRDWSECQRRNTQTAAVDMNPSDGSAAPQTNDHLARNCMVARGWSQTTEPSKPVSAGGALLLIVYGLIYGLISFGASSSR